MKEDSSSPFLTTREAADYLGLRPGTLEKMRRIGKGPVYRKHGRSVRYHLDEVRAWSEDSRSPRESAA